MLGLILVCAPGVALAFALWAVFAVAGWATAAAAFTAGLVGGTVGLLAIGVIMDRTAAEMVRR